MKSITRSPRIWSDTEIRKVAALLGILRDAEKLARTAAETAETDLGGEFEWVRNDALATLHALLADAPVGGVSEDQEDEMEATHPGTRRPPVGAKP